MQRKTVITLVETIVVIIVLFYLWLLFMSTQGSVKRIAPRVVCGTNLKGIGTAMWVYAHDNDDQLPQLSGVGPWSKKLGFEFDLAMPDFSKGGLHSAVDRTITASWYLLVREADVSPKSFVCPVDKGIMPFDGKNAKNLDLVELWDFGAEPHKHVSYAMHNPYGAFPLKYNRLASFVMAADMNPWFRLGNFVKPNGENKDTMNSLTLLPPYFSDVTISRSQIIQANAMPHQREGQNIVYIDGSSQYVKTPDIGAQHDNIYTYWSASENPTENDIRIGTNPISRSKDNDAKSADDSFLAI